MQRILFIAMIAAALGLSIGLSITVPVHTAVAGCPSYDPNCGK